MTIKQIQLLLAYLGYYKGAIDDIYGKMTADAIKRFQKAYTGLSVDGEAGKMTQKALRDAVAYDKCFASAGASSEKTDSVTDKNVGNTGTFWDRMKYFARVEFRCPCGKCGGFPVEPIEALVKLANDVREELGVPMIIVPPDGHSGGSGVRCKAYNDTLKGSSPTSTHLLGKACDFSAAGASCSKIEAILARRKAAGQIAYWYKIPGGNSYHMNV